MVEECSPWKKKCEARTEGGTCGAIRFIDTKVVENHEDKKDFQYDLSPYTDGKNSIAVQCETLCRKGIEKFLKSWLGEDDYKDLPCCQNNIDKK